MSQFAIKNGDKHINIFNFLRRFRKKDVDDKDSKKLTAGIHGAHLHIMQRMEFGLAFFQILTVFCLIFLLTVVTYIWDSPYWRFGWPLMTRDIIIDDKPSYIKIACVIVWSRISLYYIASYLGTYIKEHAFVPTLTGEPTAYWTKMFIMMTDHIMTLLPYPVMIVFIYSQFDLALMHAVPDCLLGFYATYEVVKNYREKCIAYKEALKNTGKNKGEKRPMPPKEPITPTQAILHVYFDIKDISRLKAFFVAIFAWVNVVAILLVLWSAQLLKSEYFNFDGTYVLFGRHFHKNWHYVFFNLLILFDQPVYTAYNMIVGSYLSSEVMTSTFEQAETTYNMGWIYAMYIMKKIITWTRTMFSVNFIYTNISFFLAMLVGDVLTTFFMMHTMLVMVNSGENEDNKSFAKRVADWTQRLKRMPRAVSVVTFIETFVVVGLILGLFHATETMTYFDMPPPINVFGHLIYTQNVIIIFYVYIIFNRIMLTLTSEVTDNYIRNVFHSCQFSGAEYIYSPLEATMIIVTNDLTGWVQRILSYMFILGNWSLAFVNAVVDIVVSLIVLSRFISYKNSQTKVKELYNAVPMGDEMTILTQSMRTPQQKREYMYDYVSENPAVTDIQ